MYKRQVNLRVRASTTTRRRSAASCSTTSRVPTTYNRTVSTSCYRLSTINALTCEKFPALWNENKNATHFILDRIARTNIIQYVDAVYCYRPSSVSVVRRSVSVTLVSPGKRLNQSRGCLGCGVGWTQGTTH